jgi:hypothetical protein
MSLHRCGTNVIRRKHVENKISVQFFWEAISMSNMKKNKCNTLHLYYSNQVNKEFIYFRLKCMRLQTLEFHTSGVKRDP